MVAGCVKHLQFCCNNWCFVLIFIYYVCQRRFCDSRHLFVWLVAKQPRKFWTDFNYMSRKETVRPCFTAVCLTMSCWVDVGSLPELCCFFLVFWLWLMLSIQSFSCCFHVDKVSFCWETVVKSINAVCCCYFNLQWLDWRNQFMEAAADPPPLAPRRPLELETCLICR